MRMPVEHIERAKALCETIIPGTALDELTIIRVATDFGLRHFERTGVPVPGGKVMA